MKDKLPELDVDVLMLFLSTVKWQLALLYIQMIRSIGIAIRVGNGIQIAPAPRIFGCRYRLCRKSISCSQYQVR